MKGKIVHKTKKNIFELVKQLEEEDSDNYLYRGQNGCYGPNGNFTRQIPSVFRGCSDKSEAKAALIQSRLQIAWLLDRVRQNMKLGAKDNEINLDSHFSALHLGDLDGPSNPPVILGTAQHYGIPTENLDVTSLHPAAVFATQQWVPIDVATQYPPGRIFPLKTKDDIAYIYRYDKEKLIEQGIPIGDLRTGNVGSRAILQEAQMIPLKFRQDLKLFRQGVYEIFPFFISRTPYTYRRPIQPSPLLNEDQVGTLIAVSSLLLEGNPISIRDFVVAPFYFSRLPFNPDAWQTYLGPRPDPFLILGRLIERELPRVEDFECYKDYAISIFGNIFDRYIVHHPKMKEFIKWQTNNVKSSSKSRFILNNSAIQKKRNSIPVKKRDKYRIPKIPELVIIEPGKFQMGSNKIPSKMYIDETPKRKRVIHHKIAVGKYPVTFFEFWQFVKEEKPPSTWRSFIKKASKHYPRLPAIMVSWYDASEYCEWLTKITKQNHRLLKEKEWEYVCRAGTKTNYWWGNTFDYTRANCRYSSGLLETQRIPKSFEDAQEQLIFLTEVDKYDPNPWGIFDLHGNVWEWVQDIYEDPRTSPELFAPKEGNEPFRCTRGGSWMDPELSLRSATRSWAYPTAMDRNIGFRICRRY